jgi:hypothetical protein
VAPGRRRDTGLALRHDTSVASWLIDAVPYFLPVHDAVSILDSHPPEPDMLAEVRLPFPAVTVYFGADLAFDPAFLRWSRGWMSRPDSSLPKWPRPHMVGKRQAWRWRT